MNVITLPPKHSSSALPTEFSGLGLLTVGERGCADFEVVTE